MSADDNSILIGDLSALNKEILTRMILLIIKNELYRAENDAR